MSRSKIKRKKAHVNRRQNKFTRRIFYQNVNKLITTYRNGVRGRPKTFGKISGNVCAHKATPFQTVFLQFMLRPNDNLCICGERILWYLRYLHHLARRARILICSLIEIIASSSAWARMHCTVIYLFEKRPNWIYTFANARGPHCSETCRYHRILNFWGVIYIGFMSGASFFSCSPVQPFAARSSSFSLMCVFAGLDSLQSFKHIASPQFACKHRKNASHRRIMSMFTDT